MRRELPVQARNQEEQAYEVWAASDKRELQERWDHQSVVEAAQPIVEFQPEMDMKFRIGDTFLKAKLAEYGNQVHIARLGNRYVVLLHPEDFEEVQPSQAQVRVMTGLPSHDECRRLRFFWQGFSHKTYKRLRITNLFYRKNR